MEAIKPKIKEQIKEVEEHIKDKVELTDEEKNIEEQETAFHDFDEDEEADIVIDLDLT